MTTEQKIKMLQRELQYLFPKLKHESNERDILDQPLFIDIVTRDEENGGWKSEVRPLPIKDYLQVVNPLQFTVKIKTVLLYFDKTNTIFALYIIEILNTHTFKKYVKPDILKSLIHLKSSGKY